MSTPVQYEALLQMQRHMCNITEANGYNNTLLEVNIESKDFENCTHRPAVNIHWAKFDSLNFNERDRSLQVVSMQDTVFWDCLLHVPAEKTPAQVRAEIMADFWQYFGSDYNYWLPDEENNPTIFNMLIAGGTPYGDSQTSPSVKLEIEVKVWYRMKQGDPYTIH